LAHRNKPAPRNRTRGISKIASEENFGAVAASLPNIAEFIEYGEISVGTLEPVGCVAVAADGHNSLAMLVRRKDETLAQLLIRLDLAIGLANTEDIFTDEVNTATTQTHKKVVSTKKLRGHD
jgi:hypothetical protein